MRHKPPAFPVGLYGMLLFALCWLTLPAVFQPVERSLVGATCLVPRTVATWFGVPAAAAEPEARQRRQELAEELHRRMQRHDVAGARDLLPPAYEPVFCVVREAGNDAARRGGGGQPGELQLDHTHAELAGCAELVTKGDALLGFLLRPGFGTAAEDGPDDPARVQLLNHRSARPIYCGLTLPQGGLLRLVVSPAATVDPAPLRADLWDNPYVAARLDRGEQMVRTMALASAQETVPPGLQLGRTRIWGYEDAGGDEALTIGVFVVPPIEPRALSHVVAWRDRARQASDEPARAPQQASMALGRRLLATVYDLPGAVHGRHLLSVAGRVPDGAAVVQDGLFLGTARGLWFGVGLLTSFTASRHRWSLVLLPDDPSARPRELEGEIVWAERNVACLQWRSDSFDLDSGHLPAGQLFTGSNGPHCPAGFLIGSARPHPLEPHRIVVTTPPESGPRAAEVFVGGVLP